VVRRVIRRVVRRVPKHSSQMRFREELATSDSAFAEHKDAAAAGPKHKVIRVIKRIIRIPRKPRAMQDVPAHHEVLMKLEDHQSHVTPIYPRFSEVRSKAKASAASAARAEVETEAETGTEAEAEAEVGAETKQRIHGGGQLFTKVKHTRRAADEDDSFPRFAAKGKKGGKKGGKGKKGPQKSVSQEVEDCAGCKFVWGQVEMDIGNARYVEDVQASFEHNCMDAQKSTIFYGVCEDMYDDMYAMTDDYMSNRFSVKKVCQRAKMCK